MSYQVKRRFIFGIITVATILLGCGVLQNNHGPIVQLVPLAEGAVTATLEVPPTSQYPTPTSTNTPRPTFTPAPGQEAAQSVQSNTISVVSEARPTFTLTPIAPTSTVPPIPTDTATAAANITNPTPTPTAMTPTAQLPTPTPMTEPTTVTDQDPTPTPRLLPNMASDGFFFSNLYLRRDESRGRSYLLGIVFNNNDETFYIENIYGDFFHALGQPVVDKSLIDSRFPDVNLAAATKMPFEATLDTEKMIQSFSMNIDFEDPGDIQSIGIDVLNQQMTSNEPEYCVSGSLKNQGAQLNYQLIVALILYNSQNQVLNFADLDVEAYDTIVGDTLGAFSICAETHGAIVARHEIMAWGESIVEE